MSYKLSFYPQALKEFKQLDKSIAEQFKKKIAQRLENITIIILASGKRENNKIYNLLHGRI